MNKKIKSTIEAVTSKISKRHRDLAKSALIGAWGSKPHKTLNGRVKSFAASQHPLITKGGKLIPKQTGSITATGRWWYREEQEEWRCGVTIEKELESSNNLFV